MIFAVTVARLASALLLLLSATIAAAPLHAQNKDRDIQALLANDDALAALRQQLASKQLNNVEYTRQAQQLAKARNEIVGRYDRAGQRDLVTLYRAAVNDRRAAAADAARKAAADARAQAIADAQAKQAAQQAAAKQAADEASAAIDKAIEDDAQEYTRLAIRHDELLHRLGMKQITQAEGREMPQLKAQGEQIKSKYARGGASQAYSARFEKRLAELSAEKVAPARQAWLAAGFPDAAAIAGGFSSDAQRLAALRMIDTLLWEQAGQPQAPATSAKIEAYRAMMKRIDPETQSSRHRSLNDQVFRLMHSNQFRYDVLSRFAPAYAAAPLQALREEQLKERKRAQNQKTNLAIIATALLMLALPVLYLLLGERTGAAARRNPDPNYPFQLPDSLTPAKVFRKLLGLEFDCGLIYDKEVWTETVTTHYYNPGQSYTVNGTLYTTPGNYTSNTSTITYHKYFLRAPDGRETWRQFTGNMFPASKGQVMSTVDCGDDVLFAFNHSDGTFVTLQRGINRALRMAYGRWLWLGTIGIALLGAAVLTFLLPGDDDKASRAFFAIPMVMGFFSGLYILTLKILVYLFRRMQFRLRWQSKYREFMVQRTPYLERVYSGPDRAAVRG